MKRRVLLHVFGLTVLLAVTGCDSALRPDITGNVLIRIANNTAFPFERVDVVFPEDEVSYGFIGANSASDYHPVSKAYRYAYIEIELAGEVTKFQPVDYVGESLLKPGRYSYVISRANDGRFLSLDFRED